MTPQNIPIKKKLLDTDTTIKFSLSTIVGNDSSSNYATIKNELLPNYIEATGRTSGTSLSFVSPCVKLCTLETQNKTLGAAVKSNLNNLSFQILINHKSLQRQA